jgi:hypothetical protein
MNSKAITADLHSAVIKKHDAGEASICKHSSTNFAGVSLCEEIMGAVC